MDEKLVYQTDSNGIFIGVETARKSPLDKELVWLIPAGCVEVAPPSFNTKTQFAQWDQNGWNIKDIPQKTEPEKELIPPTAEELKAQSIEDEIQLELRTMALERLAQRAKQ